MNAFFPDEPLVRLDDVEAIKAMLIAAARDGRVLTYTQALSALGHHFTRPKMRLLCRTIGAIDEGARAAGEPELAVLVVRASDGMPGEGWWRGKSTALPHGFDDALAPGAMDFVRQCQAAAFHFWRSRVPASPVEPQLGPHLPSDDAPRRHVRHPPDAGTKSSRHRRTR